MAALHRERAALGHLKQKEAATVQAQIAGIQADAYAAAFAARRKDLEDQRGTIANRLDAAG